MRTLEAVCRRLVPLYALALDLPADFFDACFAEPHNILRMSRYPIIDGEDDTVANACPRSAGMRSASGRCATASR
jgi:isopenicillin N synthase-like dioxygenase